MWRSRRWGELFFVLALVLAACGDSGTTTTTAAPDTATTQPATTTSSTEPEPTTTTEPATTTTAQPATTTTQPPPGLAPGVVHADLAPTRPSADTSGAVAAGERGVGQLPDFGDGEAGAVAADHICAIHSDQVVVFAEQRDAAIDRVAGLSPYAPPAGDDERRSALDRLEDLGFTILVVDTSITDPIAAAAAVRAEGIEASPHYVVVPTPRWKFFPGTSAEPAPDPSVLATPQSLFEGDGVVTVIDTGIPTDTSGVVDYAMIIDNSGATSEQEPGNLDPDVVGHGIFVTGIVKDLAPNVTVTLYRAAFTGDALADELSIVHALERAQPGGGVVNLSLGTYACTPDLIPLALGAALQDLDTETTVVASAGNDSHTSADPPMYPAGYDFVTSVGAAVGTPGMTAWDRATFSNDAPVWAPGEGIVSFYPSTATITSGAAIWSGTSFAAPHYAACVATGNCN